MRAVVWCGDLCVCFFLSGAIISQMVAGAGGSAHSGCGGTAWVQGLFRGGTEKTKVSQIHAHLQGNLNLQIKRGTECPNTSCVHVLCRVSAVSCRVVLFAFFLPSCVLRPTRLRCYYTAARVRYRVKALSPFPSALVVLLPLTCLPSYFALG